ncbi:MAG: transposase domain-containing protein [Myxococcota bacterium]
MRLGDCLTRVAEWSESEDLTRFRDSIDPLWIEQALRATGTATLRRRRLPAPQVLWLVIGMAPMRNRPIFEVVDKLDLALGDDAPPMAQSSIAQARV